jgi:hypothetical protein
MAATQKDLLEYVDSTHIECLNESPKSTAANCLKSGYRDQDDLCLESDADEQVHKFNFSLLKILLEDRLNGCEYLVSSGQQQRICSACSCALLCVQLLLNVPFNQKVKLQAIVIKGPADAGPRTVRL